MAEKKQCPGCSGQYAVKKDGRLWAHANDMSDLCTQEAPAPVLAEAQPGRPPTNAEVESWRAYENDMRDDLLSDPAPTVGVVDDTKPYASAPCGIQECCGDDDVQDAIDYWNRLRDNVSSAKGPWFSAEYNGRCDGCFGPIGEGDWIRANGEGGYECEDCDEDPLPVVGLAEDPSQHVPTPDEFMGSGVGSSVTVATGAFDPDAFMDPRQVTYPGMEPSVIPTKMPTPEEFMDPSSVDDPADRLNVSGQPPARYEWYGSQNRGYLVKEPHTEDFRRYKNGKPKGLTRATTFNKAASDSKAINDWGKRNIVIGASRRRDILLRAHGLTHEDNRKELEGIVAELEEAAGAKVGSDLGTYLHEFTEQMGAGLKTPDQAPEEFQGSLWRYEQALLDAGLEPVPGLIERTTMITEYGGVVGTFDRIFYHRPSDTYLIGDLKTGKTMEYAMNETETQMWVYAHGVNQNGVYDWNTDTWVRPTPLDVLEQLTVSETVGVIIHMPVQGPLAGQVVLDHADLEAGARHAELCHRNRTAPKSKVRPFEPPLPARPLTWEERFALVTSGEHATQLWREAKAAGIAGVRLNELVSVARQVLAGKG